MSIQPGIVIKKLDRILKSILINFKDLYQDQIPYIYTTTKNYKGETLLIKNTSNKKFLYKLKYGTYH